MSWKIDSCPETLLFRFCYFSFCCKFRGGAGKCKCHSIIIWKPTSCLLSQWLIRSSVDIVTWLSDYRRGFRLMVRFTGFFDTVHDYTSQVTHTHTHTHTHSAPTHFHPPSSPATGFPKNSWPQPPTSKINSSQWLNPSNPLTHKPTNSSQSCLAYDISAWTAQKTQFLCCCLQVLPHNSNCVVAYFKVVA
jgi:hypothetical protein